MKRSKMTAEELQQLKLLKIERNAGLLAMVGLCVAIVIQQLAGQDGMRELIGEYCIGGVVCIYLILSCLKNGIWDNTSKSKLKYNLLIGIVLGLVAGIGMFYGSYKMHGQALNAALSGVCVAALTFCICVAALSIAAVVYKNKAKQQKEEDEILESEPEEEQEDMQEETVQEQEETAGYQLPDTPQTAVLPKEFQPLAQDESIQEEESAEKKNPQT